MAEPDSHQLYAPRKPIILKESMEEARKRKRDGRGVSGKRGSELSLGILASRLGFLDSAQKGFAVGVRGYE